MAVIKRNFIKYLGGHLGKFNIIYVYMKDED